MGCVDGTFLTLINILPAFVTTATPINTPAHSVSLYYCSIHAMHLSPYLPSYYICNSHTPNPVPSVVMQEYSQLQNRVENLADVSTRSSGLLLKKARASGRNVGKVFNPVLKLVFENYPSSCLSQLRSPHFKSTVV